MAAFTIASVAQSATLETIKQRGMLICGANGQLPGFGLPDAQGNWTGLDVDFCRYHCIGIVYYIDHRKFSIYQGIIGKSDKEPSR